MPTVSKPIAASGHQLKTFVTIQLLLLPSSRPLLLPIGHAYTSAEINALFQTKMGTQPTSSKPGNCNRCGEPGHWARECPNKSQLDTNVITATTVVAMVAVDVAMAVHVAAMSMLAAVATPKTMVRTNVTLKTGSMLLLLQASLSARLLMELHSSGVASANVGQQAITLTCMASSVKPMCALSPIHQFGALESTQHCLSMTCGHSWLP